MRLTRDEILGWLRETDPDRLETLWHQANQTRRREVGDEIHLRGLLEISNHCIRRCTYCGVNATHRECRRYRMTPEEILDGARETEQRGYGTVVLQSGEDYGWSTAGIAKMIRTIKHHTRLAVTLSLGERHEDELKAWYQAGADRYLLRFETSDRQLYDRIHPSRPGIVSDRLRLLRVLKTIGYETGSGVMIGIPGQTVDILARDIETFAAFDLDMIGVGPYIPHPDTTLARQAGAFRAPDSEQVEATDLMTYKVIALTRLVCPRANLPSTTALGTLDAVSGYRLGLQRGANVIMPNMTPERYRRLYQIYPDKAGSRLTPETSHDLAMTVLKETDRPPGTGRGNRPGFVRRPAYDSARSKSI
jgi:biotin synthase